MRTTLILEDDVLDKVKEIASKHQSPIKSVINDALRIGLKSLETPHKKQPYHTTPVKMGQKNGTNLNNIQVLLSQIEGEDQR